MTLLYTLVHSVLSIPNSTFSNEYGLINTGINNFCPDIILNCRLAMETYFVVEMAHTLLITIYKHSIIAILYILGHCKIVHTS